MSQLSHIDAPRFTFQTSWTLTKLAAGRSPPDVARLFLLPT